MKFEFEATGIGSVPYHEAKEACRVIFKNFPKIPFWPQLPKRSFLENMYTQFSERLPGLVMDREKRLIHIETSKVAAEIEPVYQKYLDGDMDFFAISKECAEGLYEFLAAAAGRKDLKAVKGQITGPVSYALSVTDENKRSIIYDKDLFEVLTKILSMKAKWQIRRLKEVFPTVIIFIDEPYLVSVGSSYVNIDIESSMKKVDDLVDAIKEEGALAGIHCCGNTDWGMLLKRRIDILSFDAYNFTKELLLYAPAVKEFFKRGGTIAWGMVPSSDAIKGETNKALSQRLDAALKLFKDKGINEDEMSSLVTPSCGLGTLDEETAGKIFKAANSLWKRR